MTSAFRSGAVGNRRHAQQAGGVMPTASLPRQAYATDLAQADDDQALASVLQKLHARESITSTGAGELMGVRWGCCRRHLQAAESLLLSG